MNNVDYIKVMAYINITVYTRAVSRYVLDLGEHSLVNMNFWKSPTKEDLCLNCTLGILNQAFRPIMLE